MDREIRISFAAVCDQNARFVQLLLIVNPFASSVSPRTQVLVQRALGEAHEVRVAETTRRNHATRLAEDAARRGIDGVVVLGGDGTVNEVANGIVGSDCALLPLPGGSTNVFCRTLRLPDDPNDAVAHSLAAVEQGLVRPVGVGSANGRYFLFHTGVGFDAAVVEQVERQGDLKRYLNHPLFVYAAVKTWLRHYDRSEPAFSVEFSDGAGAGGRVDDGYFSICLNTDPYTYLGNRPLNVVPGATLDRGLAFVTLRTLRSSHLGRIVIDALRPPPGLSPNRFVDVRTDVGEAVLRARKPIPLQVDGDFIGTASEIRFRHHPDAIRLARTDLLDPSTVHAD